MVASGKRDISNLKKGRFSVAFRRLPRGSAFPVRAAFRVLVLSAAVCAGACATEETLGLREDPAFAAGFGDGCVTASEEEKSFSTKRARDAYEFENNRAYRAGWRQGYFQCQNPVEENDTGGRILGNEPGF